MNFYFNEFKILKIITIIIKLKKKLRINFLINLYRVSLKSF